MAQKRASTLPRGEVNGINHKTSEGKRLREDAKKAEKFVKEAKAKERLWRVDDRQVEPVSRREVAGCSGGLREGRRGIQGPPSKNGTTRRRSSSGRRSGRPLRHRGTQSARYGPSRQEARPASSSSRDLPTEIARTEEHARMDRSLRARSAIEKWQEARQASASSRGTASRGRALRRAAHPHTMSRRERRHGLRSGTRKIYTHDCLQ